MKRGGGDKRPALISCLIVANMALLQNRMQSEGVVVKGLQPLIAIKDSKNKQNALIKNWKKIREIDYAPVVDPALLVLNILSTSHQTESLLEILIDAVLNCASRIRGLQLDHAGPIYHGLLQTARYDGSFYTSTSAAVLLAELAISDRWLASDFDWNNIDELSKLKVCDPACGTGTLLMAAARTIEAKYKSGKENPIKLSKLHKLLIENVLHGLDINRHAIHLAASMMTISAPKIDYNKMNLYNMQHGLDEKGTVRAGSLDILIDNALYLPELAPKASHKRISGEGHRDDVPQLDNCDLIIMNPPFTRNDIRNRSLPPDIRELIQEHEKTITSKIQDSVRKDVIDNSAAATFFIAIADQLLDAEHGSLAMILPVTSCMNTAGAGYRKLMTDPERFHVELVVTSHDNNRIYFSENTKIHECLVVARRTGRKVKVNSTVFVSLGRNPSNVSDARFLAEAIRSEVNGNVSQRGGAKLSDYGTVFRKFLRHSEEPWNTACFYNQHLASLYDCLCSLPDLSQLSDLAFVEPARQTVQQAFEQTKTRQNTNMSALWYHKTAKQITMQAEPDVFIASKKGQEGYAHALWQKRSNLLIALRLWLKTTRTPAKFSVKPILGSAFIPVLPKQSKQHVEICKAWCVWLNSTLGILCFLNLRTKKLTYAKYSLDLLRTIPVPNPGKCDLKKLAAAYDRLAEKNLQALPEINSDSIRISLDEAVTASVPGLRRINIVEIREAISLEPSVTNRKDPFRLE